MLDDFSCVRRFVTFELKWFEVFLVESVHLSEHSNKSVKSNMGSSLFGILVSI